jgi:ribosomal protein L2
MAAEAASVAECMMKGFEWETATKLPLENSDFTEDGASDPERKLLVSLGSGRGNGESGLLTCWHKTHQAKIGSNINSFQEVIIQKLQLMK